MKYSRRIKDLVKMVKEETRPSRSSLRSYDLDLMTFAKTYLPHYLTAPEAQVHREWCEFARTLHQNRGTRLCVVGTRNAAKSVWITLAYVLAVALFDLEPYILICGETSPQANNFIRDIRHEIENNPAIARDFPAVAGRGPTWATTRINLRNGVRVEGVGAGKKIRGRREGEDRPTLVILDDPESEDSAFSKIRRERLHNWMLKAVMNIGSEETNFLLIGNAIHREGLVFTVGQSAGWISKKWASIVQWPERMDLWAAWESLYTSFDENAEVFADKFYEDNFEEMNRGAVVLWPERESLIQLMKKRAAGHSAFEAEKQCNPVNPDACEWSAKLFDDKEFFVKKFPKNVQVKAIGIDPSKGKDARRGDYSAIVSVARGQDGLIYVDANLRRRDTKKLCEDIVGEASTFMPDTIALESNQFQELLGSDILDESNKAGYVPPLWLLSNNTHKHVRIRRLGTYISRKLVRYVDSPGTRLLVDQLRDFPVGDHDDGPDAFEMAVRGAVRVYNGRTQED